MSLRDTHSRLRQQRRQQRPLVAPRGARYGLRAVRVGEASHPETLTVQRADENEARLSVSKRGNAWTCGLTSGDRRNGPTRGMPKQAVAAWLATNSWELDSASASAACL